MRVWCHKDIYKTTLTHPTPAACTDHGTLIAQWLNPSAANLQFKVLISFTPAFGECLPREIAPPSYIPDLTGAEGKHLLND